MRLTAQKRDRTDMGSPRVRAERLRGRSRLPACDAARLLLFRELREETQALWGQIRALRRQIESTPQWSHESRRTGQHHQPIGLYSPERCIADAFRHRGQLGYEIARDSLK